MVASSQSVLKEKRSEACFDEFYSRAQAKCSELRITEMELPPLKRRRVSSRVDVASHTQHHYTAKDRYRVVFFFSTLAIMLNALLQWSCL